MKTKIDRRSFIIIIIIRILLLDRNDGVAPSFFILAAGGHDHCTPLLAQNTVLERSLVFEMYSSNKA
jgi:hypothetical protein